MLSPTLCGGFLSASLARSPYFPLTRSAPTSLWAFVFDISLPSRGDTRSTKKNSRALPHLADPRTPEAVCQLQSASGVRRAVVTRNTTRWSVRVCSLMIDTTFQLKQIVNQSSHGRSQRIREYSWVHRGKSSYLRGCIDSYLVLLYQSHFREGQKKRTGTEAF